MTKRAKYKKVHKGDIFRFGDPKTGYGYGIVLLSETLLYVGVFDKLFMYEVSVDIELEGISLLLSGSTADGRIQSGAWEIVGNTKDVPNFERPNYKINRDREVWVTNFNGDIQNLATIEEIKVLNYEFSMSPIAFEKAFWAFQNKEGWEDRFNKILVLKQ